MDQILEHLWLGSFEDAENAHLSVLPKFGAVVTLCEAQPHTPLELFHMPMPDEVYLDSGIWQARIETLKQLQDARATTLVHCRLGVSRSPALVAAYLAYIGLMPDAVRAMSYVKNRRSVVNAHSETLRGVEMWWRQRRDTVSISSLP